MAFIQQRPSGSYAVVFRVDGKQTKRTFKTKREASHFLAVLDDKPEIRAKKIVAATIFQRYMETVTPRHKGARNEEIRIKKLIRDAAWLQKPVDQIKRVDIQDYIDKRQTGLGKIKGTLVSPATIIREVKTIRSVFHWAIERGLCVDNPTRYLDLPKEPEHRERVASDEDIAKLMAACEWDGKSVPRTAKQLTICAFLFSCETGMRSSEIISIEPSWVEGRVVHLPAEATKTGIKRDVGLSLEAIRLMELANEFDPEYPYFSHLSAATKDVHFREIRRAAGLDAELDSMGRVIREGLNFHDARATFATRAAKRMDVLSLARLTGHRNLKQLQKYYRESVEELAKKLD